MDIHVVPDIAIMVQAVRAWDLAIIFIIIDARRTPPQIAVRMGLHVRHRLFQAVHQLNAAQGHVVPQRVPMDIKCLAAVVSK